MTPSTLAPFQHYSLGSTDVQASSKYCQTSTWGSNESSIMSETCFHVELIMLRIGVLGEEVGVFFSFGIACGQQHGV